MEIINTQYLFNEFNKMPQVLALKELFNLREPYRYNVVFCIETRGSLNESILISVYFYDSNQIEPAKKLFFDCKYIADKNDFATNHVQYMHDLMNNMVLSVTNKILE